MDVVFAWVLEVSEFVWDEASHMSGNWVWVLVQLVEHGVGLVPVLVPVLVLVSW